MIYFKWKISSN